MKMDFEQVAILIKFSCHWRKTIYYFCHEHARIQRGGLGTGPPRFPRVLVLKWLTIFKSPWSECRPLTPGENFAHVTIENMLLEKSKTTKKNLLMVA